jgi:site-specific DNA-cytosine methylase
MKVLELFAGTRSIGKAFENRGHQVFSVEWDKNFENIDLYADILTVTTDEILNRFGRPDVIWASPDCSTFSIAAISHHRRKNPVTGNLDPVSDYAKFCDMVDQHVLQLIKDLKPRFWFIENPSVQRYFGTVPKIKGMKTQKEANKDTALIPFAISIK